MKKIIFLLLSIFILTSCGVEKKIETSENKEAKIETSFKQPKNPLEETINSLEKDIKNADEKDLLDLAKLYLQYGNSYFKEQTFADKALDLLNILGEDFEVEYLKGYAYEIKTEYDRAIKQYEKVLTLENITNVQKAKTINQIGHVLDLQGKTEEANKKYLEAEKLDPENLQVLINRGRYEYRKYNYENAKKYFNKVIKKTNNSYLKSEIYYNLSLINKDLYEINDAIKNAQLGIEANKDYPNNYLSLGVLYIIKGGEKLDEAPELFEKSIKLYPNNSIAYKYLGIYNYKKDNFREAINNFKKQIELASKDILLMNNDKLKTVTSGEYDLARTYALLGDEKNSIKYLKKVLNGKNNIYYEWFLIEYVNNDGDFAKIINNKYFKDNLKDIFIKYKNNK